jgi:hypothetical protein
MVTAAVLEANRSLGTGQGPQPRDSPRLLVVPGGEKKSLAQERHPTLGRLQNGLGARSLGPEPPDRAEMLDGQCHPPTAPPTGKAQLPQVGESVPGDR